MARAPKTGERKGPRSTVVLVVLVLVILVAGTSAFVLYVVNSGPATPESTFRKMVNGMNDGDFRDVYETSMLSHSMTYEEFVDWMGDGAEAEYDVDIEYLEVIMKDQLTSYDIVNIEQRLPQLELVIGSEIEDYGMIDCSLVWTKTNETGSDTEPFNGLVVFFKVDSKWYLEFPLEEFYQE
jgi:hypothetical protein